MHEPAALHKVFDADDPEAEAGQADWYARNAELMQRGFAWITALLTGGDAAGTRTAFETARAELAASNEMASLDRLGLSFGLAPFDLDVLLLAAALQLDTVASDALYARSRTRTADQLLALQLLAAESAERRARARSRLAADAPLRHFRFLRFQPATGAFEIDERIAGLLLGNDETVPEIEQCVEDRDHGLVPERLNEVLDQLVARVDVSRPRVGLVGPRRGARYAAAAAVARRFGLGLRTLRSRMMPADPSHRREFAGLLAREAAIGQYAVLIDAEETEGRFVAEDLLHDFPAFLIVVASGRLDPAQPMPAAYCGPLEAADRLSVWRQTLGPDAQRLGAEIEELAEHFALGPGEIARLARNAGPDGASLWTGCRDLAGSGLAGLSERIVPRLGWDDIVLPPDVAAMMRAIEAQVRHKPGVLGRGGFGRSLTRGRGTTVLFAGQSGVGKTMAAEVLAHSLGLELHKVDLSSVVSKYIGETERNLKQVFDAAEAGGCVLFLDEADSLCGKRTEIKDSHDRYANIEISYLLQRMESFSGLAILATNLKSNLDHAFMRRLRYVVDIPYPDAAQRETIWRRAFPSGTETTALDYSRPVST